MDTLSAQTTDRAELGRVGSGAGSRSWAVCQWELYPVASPFSVPFLYLVAAMLEINPFALACLCHDAVAHQGPSSLCQLTMVGTLASSQPELSSLALLIHKLHTTFKPVFQSMHNTLCKEHKF